MCCVLQISCAMTCASSSAVSISSLAAYATSCSCAAASEVVVIHGGIGSSCEPASLGLPRPFFALSAAPPLLAAPASLAAAVGKEDVSKGAAGAAGATAAGLAALPSGISCGESTSDSSARAGVIGADSELCGSCMTPHHAQCLALLAVGGYEAAVGWAGNQRQSHTACILNQSSASCMQPGTAIVGRIWCRTEQSAVAMCASCGARYARPRSITKAAAH